MSRVTEFDQVYAESHGRLLLQLYAYSADANAADDALNEAFITASRHWHRLGMLETLDRWLRERAIKRIDGRPHLSRPFPAAGAVSPGGMLPRPSPENARFLASLGSLDRVSRRLLIVRRLDNTDLASAAREVGLTDAAAEQALARATTTLHAAGVDTSPGSLQSSLNRLSEDLGGLRTADARTLRRAGTRRRYALTTIFGIAMATVVAAAGTLSAARPLATPPGTTQPTQSTTPTTPTTPPPDIDASDLLTAAQVSTADAARRWRALPASPPPTTESVYGDCMMAADNPPPNTSWSRNFIPAAGRTGALRQVLQVAPSLTEAQRAYRQVLAGFTVCPGHQLVQYAAVDGIGDRSRLVSLRFAGSAGPTSELLMVSTSGRVVTVLLATSSADQVGALGVAQLSRLAASAVTTVCPKTEGGCATPPYSITTLQPPGDGTLGGFLSVIDLPLIAGIRAQWAGTDPESVSGNPSATACDRADFAANGATAVGARSFVIPKAPQIPTLFGLSETVGTFESASAAKRFVRLVAESVKTCHKRQLTLSVQRSTSFTSQTVSGRVWQVRQRAAENRVTTFRVGLVRRGSKVAEVTFTPAGGYDVGPAQFIVLARRAAVRLGT